MFDTGAAGVAGASTETSESLAGSGVARVADAAVAFRGSVLSLDVSVLSDDELLDLVPVLEQARRSVEAALGSSLGELDVRGTTDERFGHRTAHW